MRLENTARERLFRTGGLLAGSDLFFCNEEISKRSPDGAQRNPGLECEAMPLPDFASLRRATWRGMPRDRSTRSFPSKRKSRAGLNKQIIRAGSPPPRGRTVRTFENSEAYRVVSASVARMQRSVIRVCHARRHPPRISLRQATCGGYAARPPPIRSRASGNPGPHSIKQMTGAGSPPSRGRTESAWGA